MKHCMSAAWLVAWLASSSGAWAEEPPPLKLGEFAYSMELTPLEPRAVHSLLLPLEVYRGVVSPALADLRVFNAAGDQVPHAIRTLDARREIDLGAHALPIFPIYVDPAATQPFERLQLLVDRDGSGTVIDIRPSGSKPAAEGMAILAAYVLDASAIERPIEALRIELEAHDRDYVLPLSVEASDDLSAFQAVTSGKTLVSLEYAGQRIVHDQIPLPGVRARYLRLRWPGHELPSPIARVAAVLGTEREASERQTTRVAGQARPGESGVYGFDLGGVVPVDGVRILLPEDNTMVAAELGSSTAPDARFERAHHGPVYRIVHGGATLASPPIELSRRVHRYWRLKVDPKGGGLGSGIPELEIAYRPDQLLFVARGEPPFELAYGHHSGKPSSFTSAEVLAPLPAAERDALPRSDTTAGQPRTRAGAMALVPPPPPPPYKRYVLWAVLIAGVLLLGVAALRMLREVA